MTENNENLQEAIAQQSHNAIEKQIHDPFNIGVVAEEKKEEEKPENKDATIALPLMNLDIKDNPFQKLNEATGFEFKTEAEVVEALKKSKGFEEREKDYLEKASKGETYIQFIEMLPEDLKAPVVAFAEDKDYKAVIKQIHGLNEVDFNKAWGEYDDHVPLIQKYYPDLTQEAWEALDEKGQTAYINFAKGAYTKERTDWQNAFKADTKVVKEKLDKRADALKLSIEESVAELKKNYPNMTEQQISEVRSKMFRSPLTGIVNKDGTFTKEAATKLAFADYGAQTLSQAVEAVEAKYKAEMEKQRKELGGKKLEEQVKAANDKVPKGDTKKTEGAKEKVFAEIDKFTLNKSQQFINKNSH